MKKIGRGGFSLVELLVGLALTVLILQALFPLLSTSLLSGRLTVARTVAHQAARMAVEAMLRDLRFAAAVIVPTMGNTAPSIQFKRPNSAGELETLTFQLGLSQGGNCKTLYRSNAAGQSMPLTQDSVSALRFEFQPPRLVVITLTVTDPDTGVADTIETTVTCINLPD